MAAGQSERRLAAILAADIVGYSGRVEADETATLTNWRAVQETLIQPALARHGGRVVKLLGDGFLAEFLSVVEAVECGAGLQRDLVVNQSERPESARIRLRIGINVGDVVAQAGDLLGDAVNVAARLEQICMPGGLLISASAHEQLVGKTALRFVSLGPRQLKNIRRPIEAFCLDCAIGGASPVSSERQVKPVVAALPFENLSSDPEQGYFSDGITEDIITDLSRFQEIVVVARNSSFAFRGRAGDLRLVGQQLGADYLVEGSVRLMGRRVRINAQLIEAATGLHRWAERYDCAAEDLFDVQESIARQIVASVAQRVREEQVESARRRPLEDLRAYDLVLQANRLSDDFRPEAQAQIGLLLEQALRLDPSYARVFTGLAYFHFNFWVDGALGVAVEEDDHAKKALHYAEQGVALDHNDPRCHSTLGFICVHSKQVERGLHHLDLARSMNPNDATILAIWAWAQGCNGQHEVGLTAIATAKQINPRHPPWYNMYAARLLFGLGRYEESLLQAGRYTGIPARRVRHASFQIAAFAHLDRRAEAGRLFAEYEAQLRTLWKGPAEPTVDDFVAWSVEASCFVHDSDRDHLTTGMLIGRSHFP